MEKVKQIMAWLMIISAVCMANQPRTSQELMTLLQEAQYQQQTVGNLDKAMELYRQILTEAAEIERLAARAAFQLAICYQKIGDHDKAADYFYQVVSKYSDQRALVRRAQTHLDKMVPDDQYGLFGQLPDNVMTALYMRYNILRAEADARGLHHNCHVYYVDTDFMLHRGGGGSYTNRTNTPVSHRLSLGSTSHQNMRYYDLGGRRMQIELLPSGGDQGHYNVYWTPHEPIQPHQVFTYVWGIHNPVSLPASTSRQNTFSLQMHNHPGSRIQETFFLVLPPGVELADADTSFTGRENVQDYTIYHWSSEVPENTTHSVTASLTKAESPQQKDSVFEQLDFQVLHFLSEQFGKTAHEAYQKHLPVNSHIYYVSPDAYRYQGGMNYFYNRTGRTISQKTYLGNTTNTNQTHYGLDGYELKTQLVPHGYRQNLWRIYWIPDQPLAPEESLYYGWSSDNKRQLTQLPDDTYSLRMQNHFGLPVIETFFLVLPKNMKITQSNPPTGSQYLLDFDVYWWTKQVGHENHVETVSIKKVDLPETESQQTPEALNIPGGSLGRVEIKNTGADVVEVTTDDNKRKLSLGPNGTGYFDADSEIQIGHATIKVGHRIDVLNTGSDMIRLTYHNAAGDEQEIRIGQAGVGHIRKSTPFKIGDVTIRVLENDHSARLQSLFMACGTLSDSIRRAIVNDDFHTAQQLCRQVEKHIAEGLVLARGHEIEPMLESLAEQFRIWHEVIKAQDKERAVSIGRALNESGGKMSEMIINTLSGIDLAKTQKQQNDKHAVLWRERGIAGHWESVDFVTSVDQFQPGQRRWQGDLFLKGTTFNADGSSYHSWRWEEGFLLDPDSGTKAEYFIEFINGQKYLFMPWLSGDVTVRGQKPHYYVLKPAATADYLRAEYKWLDAALSWLELNDSGQYAQSWDLVAGLVKEILSQDQWTSAVRSARRPMGKLLVREVKSQTRTQRVPGGPDGDYVIMQFRSRFEDKADAVETVSCKLDKDGQWRVSGYYIK